MCSVITPAAVKGGGEVSTDKLLLLFNIYLYIYFLRFNNTDLIFKNEKIHTFNCEVIRRLAATNTQLKNKFYRLFASKWPSCFLHCHVGIKQM